jgi:ribonucleoside-diphosphate reductase alpha chain
MMEASTAPQGLRHVENGDTMSEWATRQYLDKYSWKDESGEPTEVWPDTAYRVVENVLGTLGYTPDDREFRLLVQFIAERKFIPGGRYLAMAGRDYHPVNNCFTGDTRFITKHGVFALNEIKSPDTEVVVRNRCGAWESAHVESFGEQEIYRVTFSNGDVIETTKNHRWWQHDGTRVTTEELDYAPFGVAMSMPSISDEGIRHGVIFGDGFKFRKGKDQPYRYSKIVFVNAEKDGALLDYFKEDSVTWTQAGPTVSRLPLHYKDMPDRKNCSPEYARGFIAGLIATDGCVSPTGSVTIAQEGLDKARQISEIAVLAGCVVSSVRITSTVSPYTGQPREMAQISIKPFSAPVILPSHQAKLNANQRKRMMQLNVESVEATGRMEEVYCVVAPKTESFTLANGLITSNCFLYRCEDSREGWADHVRKAVLALSSGGGIGGVYSDVRPNGSRISATGGLATGPLSPAMMTNEVARHVMAGGYRRSAIWGGLHWSHADVFAWITSKDWTEEQKAAKVADYMAPAPLDMTNISVILNDDFFAAYKGESVAPLDYRGNPQMLAPDGSTWPEWAQRVYWQATEHMLKHGEPGFSIDTGANVNENLRNACCEITSEDDSDVCNLGSINLSRVTDKEELSLITEVATLFLIAGTVYSDIPHAEVEATRTKNRRLGLGLMGVHEWLIQRGYSYEMVPELREWLQEWENHSDLAAEYYAPKHNLSVPVKRRAIAPNGTIGIIGETTTSAEPVLWAAYRRRFLDKGEFKYQFVLDPTVERMRKEYGIEPDEIETAYTLAMNVEKRIKFQAELQEYVDHGISSTINLPYPVTDQAEVRMYGETFMEYLPKLRGFTVYPDGARAGQPFEAATYYEASRSLGVTFEESRDQQCASGICGV